MDTTRNMGSEKKDFRYWRDVIFGGLGALCIVASIGHFLDWLQGHKRIDWQIALGFTAAFGILFFFSPKRFEFVLLCLLAMIVCGTLNAMVSGSLLGLWIIVPSAVGAYLMGDSNTVEVVRARQRRKMKSDLSAETVRSNWILTRLRAGCAAHRP